VEMKGRARESVQALAQFYRSLNSGDLALMEENWETSESVAMDNPLGGIKIKRGGPKIRAVYERKSRSSTRHDYAARLCSAPCFRGGAQRMLSAPPSRDDGADRGSR
jgi:hypothetical protein